MSPANFAALHHALMGIPGWHLPVYALQGPGQFAICRQAAYATSSLR